MARRAIGGRRMTVPGLSDALAARSRMFDRSFPGAGFGDSVAAFEAGDPITLDGLTIWSALYVVNPHGAKPFEHDQNYYTLTGADTLALELRSN